jgi:hypothetical protein
MRRAPATVRKADVDQQDLGLGSVLHTHCEYLGVLVEQHERRLIAVRPIPKGTLVFRVEGKETQTPTRFSIQIGKDLHVDQGPARNASDNVARYFWRYMNHDCDPSTSIRDRQCVALRDIAPGEAVTFDYNTTEYDMAEPFACRCGSANCAGVVRGARHLTDEQKAKMGSLLPEYLR